MQEIKVPEYFYKYQSPNTQISNEGGEPLEILDIVEPRIELVIKDAQFNWKTFVTNEERFSHNMVKRIVVDALRIFTKKRFIMPFVLSLLHTKSLEYFIKLFNSVSFKLISPSILKEQHRTVFGEELHLAIFTFLYHIGISERESDGFADIISTIIDGDNAYRFRIQDILSETNAEKLQDRKEIKRLEKLLLERDTPNVSSKTTKITLLFRILLILPKYKKSFKNTLKEISLQNLQFDTGDRYWVCLKGDYKFMGMDSKERMGYAQKQGWVYPKNVL